MAEAQSSVDSKPPACLQVNHEVCIKADPQDESIFGQIMQSESKELQADQQIPQKPIWSFKTGAYLGGTVHASNSSAESSLDCVPASPAQRQRLSRAHETSPAKTAISHNRASWMEVTEDLDKDTKDTPNLSPPRSAKAQSFTPPASPEVEEDGKGIAEDAPIAALAMEPASNVPLGRVSNLNVKPDAEVPESPYQPELEAEWPYRLELDVPDSSSSSQAGSQYGKDEASSHLPASPTWQCAVMRRLAMMGNSWEPSKPAGKVWKSWSQKLEDLARRQVCGAFSQISHELRAAIQSTTIRCDTDMHAWLALAGSDIADHEATMRLVEGLVRAEFPKACVALVGPEHFRNLSTVTKNICEQIMQSSDGGTCTASASTCPASASNMGMEAEEMEAAEGEWPEDLERQLQKAGLNDCLDWYHKRRDGIVLLIERVEAVPKDTLRAALTALGSTFSSEGIPVFVIFGLQRLPQDRFDLFEGEPLTSVILRGATCLFNAREVTYQMLEWLLENPASMVALPPNILDYLRRGTFEIKRQSVSHVMKSLALICSTFFAESHVGALCVPLDSAVADTEASKESLESALLQVFDERLKQAPDMLEHLEKLWTPWCSEHAIDKEPESLRLEVAQAAAKAACWRHRLIASLQVWDALCCAMQPLSRHEPRLRRLCKIFETLWPKDSSYDATSLSAAAKVEQEKVSKLVNTCIGKLDQKGKFLSDKDVDKLLQDLVKASGRLDEPLKSRIANLAAASLESEATERSVLRTELQNWLRDLLSLYWVPLQDSARIAFREIFLARSRIGLHLEVESCVRGTPGCIAESEVKTLASASMESGKALGDSAVLYRLLECSASRAVDVADLWKNFCDCLSAENPLNQNSDVTSTPTPAFDGSAPQSTLKFRFGHGLLALHAMGLISPQAGGKADSGTSFNHWRVRKRHFGRVWLKGKESLTGEEISALCEASQVPTAADVHHVLMCGSSEAQEPKEIPRWAQKFLPQGVRDGGQLPSFLKRQAPRRPTGFDPAAKRAKHGMDKSRPRIFMGHA